jgi:hypothetical protein
MWGQGGGALRDPLGFGEAASLCYAQAMVVTEAEVAAIRAAFDQGGEVAAAAEFRRLFPSIANDADVQRLARTIARPA